MVTVTKAVISGTLVRSGVEQGVKFLASHSVAGPLIDQFSRAIERYPGGTLARNWVHEWANHLDPLKRSLIEPVIERLMHGYSASEKEGETDMADGKDKRRSGGNKGPVVSLDFIAKARQNIAMLQDSQRDMMDRLIEQIESPYRKQLVLSRLGALAPPILRREAEHFMARDGKVDLVDYYCIYNAESSESGGPAGGVAVGIKSAMLLGELHRDVLPAILEVTMDIANDSPDDQLNFNLKMANLFGDGSEDRIKKAVAILTIVAAKPIEKRLAWFNVRPNPMTKLRTGYRSVIAHLRSGPVSDEAVLAAECAASFQWDRVQDARLRRGQRQPHGGIIIVSH